MKSNVRARPPERLKEMRKNVTRSPSLPRPSHAPCTCPGWTFGHVRHRNASARPLGHSNRRSPLSGELSAEAIETELARDGSVFLHHNRVESIYSLEPWWPSCPKARAFGARPDGRKRTESVRLKFMPPISGTAGRETIVEKRMDIPRANTILIKRRTQGLAELYTVRRRVGRSAQSATPILLVPTGHFALRHRAQNASQPMKV